MDYELSNQAHVQKGSLKKEGSARHPSSRQVRAVREAAKDVLVKWCITAKVGGFSSDGLGFGDKKRSCSSTNQKAQHFPDLKCSLISVPITVDSLSDASCH